MTSLPKEFEDRWYGVKIDNPETGEIQDFLLSYCGACAHLEEPTSLTLAEWSNDTKRLECKVTGVTEDGRNEFDYWCWQCGFGHINTEVMRIYVKVLSHYSGFDDILKELGISQDDLLDNRDTNKK